MPCILIAWRHVPCQPISPIRGGGQLSLIPIFIISLHSLCDLLDVLLMLLGCTWMFQMGLKAQVGFLECLGIGARKLSLGLEVSLTLVYDHCTCKHHNDLWYSTFVASFGALRSFHCTIHRVSYFSYLVFFSYSSTSFFLVRRLNLFCSMYLEQGTWSDALCLG